MMMITMIMMIILISQWNCSDIRDLINQGRSCILSKGGGGRLGSNPRCLPDCHVGIHTKSDTHFFACAVCEAGGICPHPIQHWRASWQEGPSILSNKILSPTVVDDENTLIRKGTFNDGFFEKISTAYISSFKKSESLRLTWASVNQYPSVLR